MHKKRAFTLIELLVVIAIIALLMSILIPALSAAKKQAEGAVCLSNERGLITAYLAYAHDNDDQLVCGNTFPPASSGWSNNPAPPDERPWALPPIAPGGRYPNGPYYMGANNLNVTEESRFHGLREGALYPYCKDVKLYHCPADYRYRKGTVGGSGPGYRMWRSYEIQGGLNAEEADPSLSGFALKRLSQIKHQATTYVFVEGYYDGIAPGGGEGNPYNGGSWLLDQDHNGQSWWNVVSIWHVNSYNLSFADGHSSKWKCKDKRTIEHSKNRKATPRTQPGNPDLEFLIKNYAVRLPRP
jgi:prepilin-type N-terminal cleavage/methylation domain-containing protein/prepilin-type processing-associated H-X9-DG protein